MKLKKIAVTVIAFLMTCGMILTLTACPKKSYAPQPKMLSANVLEGASVEYQSLKAKKKPTAANILGNNKKYWSAYYLDRNPSDGKDTCNVYTELKLSTASSFNTAIIEEIGSEVLYFRIQAYIDGEFKTVYQTEKIQTLRVCSFDTVTTDRVRLSIDKFRSAKKPAKIKSFKLYNETGRGVSDLNVTVYQRLDRDVPTEILAKGDGYAAVYAKYYDVYNTVLVFDVIDWDRNGNMLFKNAGKNAGQSTEADFARELAALKQIIDMRENKSREVRIIVTGVADGASSGGINNLMKSHKDKVADTLIAFVEKYALAGIDIDWEYPSSKNDWANFDSFITRLDKGMKKLRSDAILSAALSAWALGMKKETLARFDQIQFMNYDGRDKDGFQSTLQQAQDGLSEFIKNGADVSKINIGIAAFARPVTGEPYWPEWRYQSGDGQLYWSNKYYNVLCEGQIMDAVFVSPGAAGDALAYALFSGVGGVMVFRIACDKLPDDPNSIAMGLKNAMIRHA